MTCENMLLKYVRLALNAQQTSHTYQCHARKVLPGSQAIRQANLKAGFGVAAVGGKPASS